MAGTTAKKKKFYNKSHYIHVQFSNFYYKLVTFLKRYSSTDFVDAGGERFEPHFFRVVDKMRPSLPPSCWHLQTFVSVHQYVKTTWNKISGAA